MLVVVCSGLAFCAGGALLEPSGGFTRLVPSVLAAACFVVGAGLLARAVQRDGLAVPYVAGLGVEATGTLVVAVVVLGERFGPLQVGGLVLVVAGTALLIRA